MKNCLNCGKEVIQTPGKKEKKYCDAKCRQKHWQQLKKECKGNITLPIEEYKKLVEAAGQNNVNLKQGDKNNISIAKEISSVKLTYKPVVKELNKEGSKPYKPKEENPRFKIVNGKRVFK